MGEVQLAILNVIRDRIFREGRLATGEKLITDAARYQPGQSYSRRNKAKANRGHVDLYITGEFYESMSLRVGSNITNLVADKIATIHENFQDMFQTPAQMLDALGTLTKEEIDLISQRVIMPYIIQDLKRILNV